MHRLHHLPVVLAIAFGLTLLAIPPATAQGTSQCRTRVVVGYGACFAGAKQAKANAIVRWEQACLRQGPSRCNWKYARNRYVQDVACPPRLAPALTYRRAQAQGRPCLRRRPRF